MTASKIINYIWKIALAILALAIVLRIAGCNGAPAPSPTTPTTSGAGAAPPFGTPPGMAPTPAVAPPGPAPVAPPPPAFPPTPPPPADNTAEVIRVQLMNPEPLAVLAVMDFAALNMGHPGVPAVVAGQLSNTDVKIAKKARDVLIAAGSTSVDPLIGMLDGADENLRKKILDCLFWIGVNSVDPLIKKMGETQNFFVREGIGATLVALRDNVATKTTTTGKLTAAQSNLNPAIKLAAYQVLNAP